MGNRIKRTLLCLLAVSAMTAGGSIHAGSETERPAGETAQDSGEDTSSADEAKRSESAEETDFSAADVKKYFSKAGSGEGIDFYIRPESYDGDIGEAAALYTSTGEPAAQFSELTSDGDVTSYISDGGRFLVTVTSGKLTQVRRIVSSLDSPNAFLTDGGKRLDLMDEDNEELEESYVLRGEKDGMKLYENSDGSENAWLSADGRRFYGTFRYAAESEEFRLIYDRRTAILGIENKSTGYIWWSSPLDASQDTRATQLLADELRSSNTMNYGKPEKRNNNNPLRSGRSSDCDISVTEISGGIRVVYNYRKAGFRYPVEYTLEGDHMKASLKVADIEETNKANIATEMTVLGSFGAASDKEEGYFVVPDGSGALIRFNNGRSMGSSTYRQRVYGSDVTAVPTTQGALNEQVYLPVYGIVKPDNAMLVVASKGDSNALISAKTTAQSDTSYNICGFTFILRGTDTYYMSGSNEKFTMFESGKIKSDDIELLYYPIAKKGADYVDIAECYRSYLTGEAGVPVRAEEGSAPAYIDLYGGVMKKRSVLGIPINMKTAVTKYSDAETILTKLRDSGVDDMVVSYTNWTNNGIKNKVDTGAKPSYTLGGKKKFGELEDFIEDNGFELYPVSDNSDFYSGNGYYSFTGTSVRISGSYSRIVSYDRAYGVPDGRRRNMSLLSPKYYGKVFSKASSSYDKAGLDGISVGSLTTLLYGDYGKKNISRYGAMNRLVDSYAEINEKLENGILADNANAYALPYVSRISGVPLNSSRYDIFDEDIPFYQLVMHGIIPYSSPAINGSSDPEELLLMAAASGSSLSYDMTYAQASKLKDTEFDIYYYANYANWIDTAAAEYKLLAPILKDVSGSTFTGYESDNGVVTASYSNGTVVKVDFNNKTIDFNGQLIDVEKYAEEGGIRF